MFASLSRTATTAGRWRSDRFLRIARCIGDLRIVGNVQLENGRWATNENQRLAGPETRSIGLLSTQNQRFGLGRDCFVWLP